MIGHVISQYKILEKLGEGGMSQTFPRAFFSPEGMASPRVDESLSIPLERSGSGSCGL